VTVDREEEWVNAMEAKRGVEEIAGWYAGVVIRGMSSRMCVPNSRMSRNMLRSGSSVRGRTGAGAREAWKSRRISGEGEREGVGMVPAPFVLSVFQQVSRWQGRITA
jgi:hypothetical protein